MSAEARRWWPAPSEVRLTGRRSEDEPSGVLFLLAEMWLADMVVVSRPGVFCTVSSGRCTADTRATDSRSGYYAWGGSRDAPAAPAGLKGARRRRQRRRQRPTIGSGERRMCLDRRSRSLTQGTERGGAARAGRRGKKRQRRVVDRQDTAKGTETATGGWRSREREGERARERGRAHGRKSRVEVERAVERRKSLLRHGSSRSVFVHTFSAANQCAVL